jgi:hypothetical protein
MSDETNKAANTTQSPDVPTLEADVAYFQARLAFARRGEDTTYKQAQRRAYQALSDSLNATLKKHQK